MHYSLKLDYTFCFSVYVIRKRKNLKETSYLSYLFSMSFLKKSIEIHKNNIYYKIKQTYI